MRAPWLFGFSPVMRTFQRVNFKKKFAVAKVKIQFTTAGLLCGGVSRRIDVLIAMVNVEISQAHKGNCWNSMQNFLSYGCFTSNKTWISWIVSIGLYLLYLEGKPIANTSYKCVGFLLLCVLVIVQCPWQSTWRALEANDTYFVTTPGRHGCRVRACPRMTGCWSDSRCVARTSVHSRNQAGNLSHASLCSLPWVSHVQDCDFSRGHKEAKGGNVRQKILLQISQKSQENADLSEIGGKTQNTKKSGNN